MFVPTLGPVLLAAARRLRTPYTREVPCPRPSPGGTFACGTLAAPPPRRVSPRETTGRSLLGFDRQPTGHVDLVRKI